jgi:antitoxin PrlF
MVAAKITSKGQITVPKEIRDRLGVGPGDTLEFEFDGDRLEVRPKRRRSILEFRGIFRTDRAGGAWAEQREAAWDEMTKRLRPR